MPLPAGGKSAGQHPFNSALYVAAYGTTDPTSITDLVARFTEVVDLSAINGVELKPATTDITCLRSPFKAKEKIPGFIDAGQITATFVYSQTAELVIMGYLPTSTAVAPSWGRMVWCVVLPDEGVFVSDGFLAGQPLKAEGDNPVTADLTIELSGLPRFYGYND